MYTKFSTLFSFCAKHLDRFFSTLSESECYSLEFEFHQMLVNLLNEEAERCFQDPSRDKFLPGSQVELLISALNDAEREFEQEETFGHTLNRFNFPNRFFSPAPERYPYEHCIYARCCSLAEVEA